LSAAIAVVDGGSFVLPYDFQLTRALAARYGSVDFYGSKTRYNGEFLEGMGAMPHVAVFSHAVSGTVSPRWKGVLAYAALLARLLWRSRRYRVVNLQFSVLWPLELPVWWLLRRKLVFTVHNAVPHGFRGQQHAPTRWIAAMARALVFVSEATRDDFLRRYGERFRVKSTVLAHGLLPVAPDLGAVEYMPRARPRSLVFWSTVKPYKGVELFAQLARAETIRRRGLSLEVYGAWASELAPLRAELVDLGVKVHDGYLERRDLLNLLSSDAVFLLPYQAASQSGALYSLLNHGCLFICADAGDLGAFMRRFGLQGLLLRERSAEAVVECLDHLEAHRDDVIRAFREAQQQCRWDRLIAGAGSVYGPR
jgi:glycosyltransferase involved in cell wall biosynthesis